MGSGIILPLAKSIISKIAAFTGEIGNLSSSSSSSSATDVKTAKSVKKDLKKIADLMKGICAVLEDADEKQSLDSDIRYWLQSLNSFFYDIDDLLDEVVFDARQRAVNKGRFRRQLRYYLSSSNPLILSHNLRDLCKKLKRYKALSYKHNLTVRLVEYQTIDSKSTLDGFPYVPASDIIGRDEDKQYILDKIKSVSDASHLSVLSIAGLPGIGKTALAKLVYRDVHHFDLKLWVCVSDDFHVPKIIEDILKDGTGDTTPDQDMNILVKKLHGLLTGKKYFLVLDDVWEDNREKWYELENVLAVGEAGIVILITARRKSDAFITGTTEQYDLEALSDDVCWSIFTQLAFNKGEEEKYHNLRRIGRSIVKKCNGNPLFVKSLAGLLRSLRDDKEWQHIHDIFRVDNFMDPLKLSYDKLPWHLKLCFAHLSLFVNHIDFSTNAVSYLWSSLGLLPVTNSSKDIEALDTLA